MTDLEQHIRKAVEQAVKNYLDQTDLDLAVGEIFNHRLDQVVNDLNNKLLTNYLSNNDLESKMSALVQAQIQDKLQRIIIGYLTEQMQKVDIKHLLQQFVDQNIDIYVDAHKFKPNSIDNRCINWDNASLPASVVSGTISKFSSDGIRDKSTQTQITVTNDQTVINNVVVTDNIISKTITTNKLQVQQLELGPDAKQTVIEASKQLLDHLVSRENWDMFDKPLVNQDKLVLSADTLGPGVIHSNLRRLGNLAELTVLGNSQLADTLMVGQNRRVGINTTDPAGTLTIWDQDAEITITKNSAKNMFVGSTRQTSISLGSNNKDQIKITPDDVVEINSKLRLQGRLISISDKIPEHQGEPGEITFVGNMIFTCRGGNSWQKLV